MTFKVVFSIRGNRLLIVEIHGPGISVEDDPLWWVDNNKKPIFGQSAEDFAEYFFKTESTTSLANEWLRRERLELESANRKAKRLKRDLADHEAMFEAWWQRRKT